MYVVKGLLSTTVIRPACKHQPAVAAAQRPPAERRGAPRGQRVVKKKPERAAAPERPPAPEQHEYEAPSSSCSKLTALNRYRALVLDSTYQPIDVVNWQRALCLEIAGNKVDVLEYYDDIKVKAPRDEFLLPAVVRVRYFSRRGKKSSEMRLALNRHNIFMRDNFMCQYCGADQHLTLDHVIPSSMGGGNSWENLVTCCSRCNSAKGSKSLAELRWKLKSKPREPSPHELTMLVAQWSGNSKAALPPQWSSYLQPLWRRQQQREAPPAL